MIAEKYQNQVWNKNINNAALVRLDTGIGMSFIINGEIYHGSFDKSAELGHLVVNPDGPKCVCGNFGCLETYASGDGLLHRFAEAIENNEPTIIDVKSGKPERYEELGQAAEKGDPLCIRLFNQMGKYLGMGISNVINLFDPTFVILYGSSSKYKDLFFAPMINTIEKSVWHENSAKIIFSSLDLNAAAIGAALAASNRRLDEIDDLKNL
jgi:predicted NBD/HSP70 family sugar kinase